MSGRIVRFQDATVAVAPAGIVLLFLRLRMIGVLPLQVSYSSPACV